MVDKLKNMFSRERAKIGEQLSTKGGRPKKSLAAPEIAGPGIAVLNTDGIYFVIVARVWFLIHFFLLFRSRHGFVPCKRGKAATCCQKRWQRSLSRDLVYTHTSRPPV